MVRRIVWLSAPLAFAAALLGAARPQAPSPGGTPSADAPIPSVPIIRIVRAAKPKIPIALPAFTALVDPRVQGIARTVHDALNDDLDFSGYFSLVPEEYHKLVHTDPSGRINYKEWIGVGADALVFGQVALDQGNIVFEGKLFDTADQKLLLGKRYRGEPDLARIIAHKLSNEIVQQFTDQPGISLTKIAFVSQVGKAKEIYVMDYDGARAKRITANNTINLSPAWLPDGKQIAFVSYRSGTPVLMIVNSEGELRQAFPQQGELNSAPAWSPDGKQIAFTARVSGGFDIFLLDIDAQQVARLTENSNINEWPRFSPDGKHLAFASNRTGNFDVYTMDIDGTHVRRLTHGGNSYSPSWSR